MKIELKGKVIGNLTEDNGKIIFTKSVNSKKHYFYKYGGYGVDASVYNNYLKGKEGVIRIMEENGDIYTSPISAWANAFEVSYGEFGKQFVLPIDEMTLENTYQ